MPPPDWMMYLGLSPPDCFAGFCGGVVYAIGTRIKTPIAFVGAVVLGTLTANWFGVMIGVYFPGAAAHAGSFFTGCFGWVILRSVLKNFVVEAKNGA
jgi:hypothetical protein